MAPIINIPPGPDKDRKQTDPISDEFNRFRGKLAGFIEACGLEEKQERGIIRTMKSLSYEAEKNLKDALAG